MGVRAVGRGSGFWASVVVGLGVGWPSGAHAQGAQQAVRSAGGAAGAGGAAAPAAEARLAGAQGVLRTLAGRWRFAVRFAGNLDGPPDATGTRVITPLFDALRLEWTETLDGATLDGRGILGFDPATGRFFDAGVYSTDAAPELLAGTLDPGEPRITFAPLPLGVPGDSPGAPAAGFVLTVVDDDHFLIVPLDRSWRAVFTRQP
jgi:hypothetical protein